jgi:RNA polymerase sigma factor (sigma-70 family)
MSVTGIRYSDLPIECWDRLRAAEDVVHDCFLGLIKEPGRFDSTKASLRTYLYAAARNQAAKRYLKSNRESGIEELAREPQMAAHLDPIRQVLDNELAGEGAASDREFAAATARGFGSF